MTLFLSICDHLDIFIMQIITCRFDIIIVVIAIIIIIVVVVMCDNDLSILLFVLYVFVSCASCLLSFVSCVVSVTGHLAVDLAH
jgi:hypothetical protein